MKIILPFLLIFLATFGKVVAEITENKEDAEYLQDKSYPDYGGVGGDQPEIIHEAKTSDATSETTTQPPVMDCECAVFSSISPTSKDTPILTQVPSYIDCMHDGEEDCIALCSILAKAAWNHGPKLICSILGNYNHFRASIHSRVSCDSRNKWVYTGLTSPDEICCLEHRVTTCAQTTQPTQPMKKSTSLNQTSTNNNCIPLPSEQ